MNSLEPLELPEPTDPLAAATHRDPYPYYARLVREHPLYHDARLGLWVASSASAVTEILASEHCHVRPVSHPVPSTIERSPAGELFRRLVRMNDGENHCPLKRAIRSSMYEISPATLLDATQRCALALRSTLASATDLAGLTRFMFALPVQTMGTLLGIPASSLTAVTGWIDAFVTGISPIATAVEVEHCKTAAACLVELCGDLLDRQRRQAEPALLNVFARQSLTAGCAADDWIIANGVGLMSQTYEATAGLIGNTLLALARRTDILAAVRDSPELLGNVVGHILCADPPTQSTRRFVIRKERIAGAMMNAGDTILVMLAAAGRDPALNPCAEHFDFSEESPRTLDFGAGRHACPADRVAPLIAREAVAQLLAADFDVAGLVQQPRYRRSHHVRAPMF